MALTRKAKWCEGSEVKMGKKYIKVDFAALSSELLCMTDTQAGKFLRLLCMQAGMGAVPEASALAITNADPVVMAMFKRTEKGYENVMLAEAMLQSAAYSDSRRENKTEAKAEKKGPEKLKYAENVLMTAAEYTNLVNLYGRAAAEKFVEILDNYKGACGKKYKSDYRAILNWVISRCEKDYPGLVIKKSSNNPEENPFGGA